MRLIFRPKSEIQTFEGGLFSIFYKKSASKPPKRCDFAYFTSQWGRLEPPPPFGYATAYSLLFREGCGGSRSRLSHQTSRSSITSIISLEWSPKRFYPRSSISLVHLLLGCPHGLLPFALASKACLWSLSWGILFTWPNNLSWEFSIRRSNCSMLRDFRISELSTLSGSVTPSILRKILISDACTCDRILSVITQDSWPHVRMGTKTVSKIGSFALWQFSLHGNRIAQSSHYCCSLPTRVSSSLSCFPSLVNATPRYLNFSTCFIAAPFTCNRHWSGFLEIWRTSVLAVLIFIPAVLHASAKLFNAHWRPDSVEESRTKSSTKSRPLILQFPTPPISLTAFVDPIYVNNKMRGDKTHPCRSQRARGTESQTWARGQFKNYGFPV